MLFCPECGATPVRQTYDGATCTTVTRCPVCSWSTLDGAPARPVSAATRRLVADGHGRWRPRWERDVEAAQASGIDCQGDHDWRIPPFNEFFLTNPPKRATVCARCGAGGTDDTRGREPAWDGVTWEDLPPLAEWPPVIARGTVAVADAYCRCGASIRVSAPTGEECRALVHHWYAEHDCNARQST